MTEMLHWYAETTGGVRQGDAPVHPGCGALHLSADLPAGTLKTVRAELPWTMEADERLFMNGYQTWTYSPELDRNGKLRGTDHIPGFLRKKYAFDRYGDYHFAPYGHQKGQSHGFSYCYFRKGTQFRLVASLDETPGYTILRYDSGKALLTLERDCAGVEHPGGSFPLLDLFFAEGGETEVFDGWFQAMGIKPRTEKKLAGYSSWYNRYQDITEDTIREDLTGCRSLLCPGDLFQIDDGWEPKVGDWLETDAQKFPHGLKGMVQEIHASGFQAGLWLAPFVCEKDSALFRQRPREPGGQNVPCYGAFAQLVWAKADSRLRRTGDTGFRAGGLLPCQLRRELGLGRCVVYAPVPSGAGVHKAGHQQHGIPAAAQWPCLWQRPGCVLPPGGKLQVDGRAKTHPCHGQCPAGQCVPYLGYAVPLHGCAAGRVPPSAHPL